MNKDILIFLLFVGFLLATSILSAYWPFSSTPSYAVQPEPTASFTDRAYIDDTKPGWVSLTAEDFTDVNGEADTWSWEGDMLTSTGEPIGVLRTEETFRNFEMVIEWRHLKDAGNSGMFAWVPMSTLDTLVAGQLPGAGIEVQMLDHGYKTRYEPNSGNTGDWFSTNGDIFPVGASKLTAFPPTSPNGVRSFPSENRSNGFGKWNHYYVRGINGEIRLWVNGAEVSGGTGAEPAEGHLCMEAEGSPIEFRKLRIRELP